MLSRRGSQPKAVAVSPAPMVVASHDSAALLPGSPPSAKHAEECPCCLAETIMWQFSYTCPHFGIIHAHEGPRLVHDNKVKNRI